MKYSEYGKTGKMVSTVGFGGMRFEEKNSLEENAELVRYAFSRGINYFDTAPGYCGGKSEEIYGQAFKEMQRDKFYVCDKLMPDAVNSVADVRGRVCSMIDKMGVGWIDFFHVWCVRRMEHFETAMRPGGLYEGLLRCREEGLIKHIVFSSHQQGNEVEKIIASEKFEGVLLGVNILNFPYRWPGVLAARRHDMGVVAMNPLSGGLIPQNEERLQFLAAEGETPTETALRFLISNENITVALNGFTIREHIDTACRIADNDREMTDAELKRIKFGIADNSLRICTSCGYCDGCPAGIPVSKYMQVYNDKILFNVSAEEFKEKLDFHHTWGLLAEGLPRAAECIACGKCEHACTQHLPIIKRLKEFADLHG